MNVVLNQAQENFNCTLDCIATQGSKKRGYDHMEKDINELL